MGHSFDFNQYDAKKYQKWFTNCVGNPWKHNQLTGEFSNAVHTIYIELFCSGIYSHANQVQKVNELKFKIMKQIESIGSFIYM